jgi:hypothetical protein
MSEHGRKLGRGDAALLGANRSMTGEDHLGVWQWLEDRSKAQKAQDRQNALYWYLGAKFYSIFTMRCYPCASKNGAISAISLRE